MNDLLEDKKSRKKELFHFPNILMRLCLVTKTNSNFTFIQIFIETKIDSTSSRILLYTYEDTLLKNTYG